MAAAITRQPSASDIHAYYASPPSPKSPAFVKGHSGRRPSFSVTSWLGRSSGQAPSLTSSPATKVLQISDPQPTNPYDAAAKAPGALGKGATVVRTPHQALNTNTFSRAETPNEKDELEVSPVMEIRAPAPKPIAPLVISAIHRRDSPVSRRESPVPRRESPAPSQVSAVPPGLRILHTSKSHSHLQTSPRKATTSPPPRAPPMPLNLASSRQPLLRSTLSKPPSPTKATGPFLPLLPPPKIGKETPPSTPLPPFHPVLMSSVPTHPAPPSQIIVTLETSTTSQRTTVATLISRPSRLASYLQALVPSANKDDSDSSFSSLFAAHLAQAGLVPQAQTSYSGPIQIFLDRPSAPYAHILTYLRSATNASGVLPRAASLALDTGPARAEALCELRDEARYLELFELVELCDKELRARAPKLRSTASTSSLREFKFGSGSEGSGGVRTSSVAPEVVEARLREYRFGVPSVEALPEEVDEEEENSMQVPPVVYEKKGSHAGNVVTVPPRGLQLTGSKPPSVRAPPSQGRTRTISDVRYHTSENKTWI